MRNFLAYLGEAKGNKKTSGFNLFGGQFGNTDQMQKMLIYLTQKFSNIPKTIRDMKKDLCIR